MPDRGVVAFQGRREGRSAFALVNAQWSRALSRAGYRVVDFNRAADPPEFLIHHDFESHFTAFEPPPAGKCIAVRTWDFGPLPPAWTGKINREFHQYWAYSGWIAEQTSCVKPGSVSSAERAPPPISSFASYTATE